MSKMEGPWQRPKSVTVPTVWSIYESDKPMANGVKPRFRIQDFTEEYRQAVLDNMTQFFLRDEPLSKSLNIKSNPAAVNSYASFVKDYLERKMALIAVVENLNELGDEKLPLLAGCNITAVLNKHEKDDEVSCDEIRLIVEALELTKKMNDPFEYFGVTEYLSAYGLSVHPLFRGHNLGYELLKARFPLCKAAGVKATVTVFTAASTQKSAAKLGFETLSEIVYDEYKNAKGEIVFKIDSTKSMKLMGVRIP